jgi:hypothetical protein
VPCSPCVPSPDVFEHRPVVHAERFGMGRYPKTFTRAGLFWLSRKRPLYDPEAALERNVSREYPQDRSRPKAAPHRALPPRRGP